MVFFFKQKTAYEMRISDWSSDVCSSDLTPVALQYDSGDYDATLDAALKLADVDGFPRRKQEAASRGKLRGLGFSTYLEACGIAPSSVVGSLGARAGLYESANVRVHPTGSGTVYTGSHGHGQGHETTFAQHVSETLGLPLENVDIVHGDNGTLPFGQIGRTRLKYS